MKATFISREKNDVKFKMEFTQEEFAKSTDEAYLKNRGKYAVDGFRKGKAPRKLIETHYGEDTFIEDGINTLFSSAYKGAVESLDLKPIDTPAVDFEDFEQGRDFFVIVTVTVAPEVKVKDYKGVEVSKIEHVVSEEDIEKELKALQKRNSRLVLVERPAKNGDTVLIDYAGFVGDHQFDGGTAERQPLTLGSDSFIPGFEEQLVGAKVGEEVEVKVTFPTEYHSEDLAGKDSIFKVKVHEIKENEEPEINDEFAKDVSEFETLDELKTDTRAKLEKTAASKAEYEHKNAVLEKIYNAHEVDIPNIMVEDQIDEMMAEFDQQLKYQGLDLEKYFEYLGKDAAGFRADLKDDAFKKVKTRLLVEAIADAENFEISDEEMDSEINAMALQYKMEADQVRKAMKAENFVHLIQDLKMRKAVEFISANAIIK